MGPVVATCVAGLAASCVAAAEPSDKADVAAMAQAVLVAWIEAYRSGDYHRQWALTDSRIRYWHDRRRWNVWMKRAARRNGPLDSYVISARGPIDASQLPCTEHGHCFRSGVDYVLLIVATKYGRATPDQPEYAVMARSAEGWRFGGGSILNRPLGETAVILTEFDQRSYSVEMPRGEGGAPH